MITKDYNCWIIDLDGTLVDSREDITSALNMTFTAFKLPTVSSSLVEKYVGTGILEIVRQIVPGELMEEYLKEFDRNYLENIAIHSKLYSGWEEVLRDTPNIYKIILSNKYLKFCNALVKELRISNNFVAIYGRESFTEHKPNPLPIFEILRLHKYAKDKTLIIGDTINDIEAGKSAGIDTCGALYGYSEKAIVLNSKPTYTIDLPIDLLKI